MFKLRFCSLLENVIEKFIIFFSRYLSLFQKFWFSTPEFLQQSSVFLEFGNNKNKTRKKYGIIKIMSILVTFSKFLMQWISLNYYQNNTLNNLRLAEFSSFSTSFIPNIQSSLNPCFYHLLSPLQVQLKKLINDIKHTPLVFQISNTGPILSL